MLACNRVVQSSPTCGLHSLSRALVRQGISTEFIFSFMLQVSEDRLISLLEQINEQQQSRTRVTVSASLDCSEPR